jgi:hypothetical protein
MSAPPLAFSQVSTDDRATLLDALAELDRPDNPVKPFSFDLARRIASLRAALLDTAP